jgi:hypothetical protein
MAMIMQESRMLSEAPRNAESQLGGPRSVSQNMRHIHSAPMTPSGQRSYPAAHTQVHVPTAGSQLPDTATAVQQHLDNAYALLDFVSHSVEELQGQLHCSCDAQMPIHAQGCAATLPSASAVRTDLCFSDAQSPDTVPGIGKIALEAANAKLGDHKSTVVSSPEDISRSMQQLLLAHLQAMEESARSTLAIRTGKTGRIGAPAGCSPDKVKRNEVFS